MLNVNEKDQVEVGENTGPGVLKCSADTQHCYNRDLTLYLWHKVHDGVGAIGIKMESEKDESPR